MKISFLVTYYNQEAYVRQSLDSILAINKPSEWEILVGDDGSSDGTVSLVNEYIDKYPNNIHLYIMPRDKGQNYDSVQRASLNRLNLLEHATGDCFCTLDGDDFYYDKNFVLDAISIFERYSDVSVVSFGYSYYQNNSLGREFLLPVGADQRVDTKYYLSNLYLPAGACVYRICWDQKRIDYIKKIGYFDDNDIVINSLNYGKMFYINRSIYAYRQTGRSIYTSMSAVEQAVLNAIGYDVGIKLIDKHMHDVILYRYGGALLVIFLYRMKIKTLLGEEKFNKYIKISIKIDDSITYKVLTLDVHNAKQLITKFVTHKPKLILRMIFRFLIQGHF